MSASRIQIVVDANDPGPLAAFWATASGYVEEELTDFVRGLLDAGHAPPEATEELPGGRLRWRALVTLRHPDDGVDERGAGTGRRILFQEVPEPRVGKNRLHLDLLVGPDRREAEVERIVGAGATVVEEVDEHGSRHTILADPEGNVFCVA